MLKWAIMIVVIVPTVLWISDGHLWRHLIGRFRWSITISFILGICIDRLDLKRYVQIFFQIDRIRQLIPILRWWTWNTSSFRIRKIKSQVQVFFGITDTLPLLSFFNILLVVLDTHIVLLFLLFSYSSAWVLCLVDGFRILLYKSIQFLLPFCIRITNG